MKNILIPISVKPNALTEDVVTVGLLAFNKDLSFYDFSFEKLRIAKSFLDENSKNYLEGALKSLKDIFLNVNDLREIEFSTKLLNNEKYLDYLSKYSNGIIKFGEPKGFAINLNETTFNKAFKAFVGGEPGKIIYPTNSFRNEMRAILKDNAFKKVDVHYTVTPSIVPEIYTSHKLDFIGVNGSPYAGLGIDFSKTDVEVDKTILTFRSIVKGLSERAIKNKMESGTYEVYFNEPESHENKILLDKVIEDKSKGFKLLPFEKMDRVIEKLNNGDYIKFSESKLANSSTYH